MTDEQRQRVAAWIEQGAKLAEIQNRLASEFGITLTYMEARFLVDDLKLTPKDPEPPKSVVPEAKPAGKPAGRQAGRPEAVKQRARAGARRAGSAVRVVKLGCGPAHDVCRDGRVRQRAIHAGRAHRRS